MEPLVLTGVFASARATNTAAAVSSRIIFGFIVNNTGKQE
jgi:hypothetical protein